MPQSPTPEPELNRAQLSYANRLHLMMERHGWPEVLTWNQRSQLASRAGVPLPDDECMPLLTAAKLLVEDQRMLPTGTWIKEVPTP